jgi:hypothetical protein
MAFLSEKSLYLLLFVFARVMSAHYLAKEVRLRHYFSALKSIAVRHLADTLCGHST